MIRKEGVGREKTKENDEEGINRCMIDEITEEEIGKALGRMADGKATGKDGIPIECVKKNIRRGEENCWRWR